MIAYPFATEGAANGEGSNNYMIIDRSFDVFSAEAPPVYRYMLIRDWGNGGPLLHVCMKNPSHANRHEDDRTTDRLRKRFEDKGYGGVYVVNLNAVIDPNAKIVLKHADPVGNENESHIVEALKSARSIRAPMLVGWGQNSNGRGQVDRFVTLASQHEVSLVCLKTNRDGSPLHPGPGSLQFSRASNLVPWAQAS